MIAFVEQWKELTTRLRNRAAHNAHSMEAEARAMLEAALAAPEEDLTDLASFARGLFAPLGGIELELPSREPAREPPTLEEQAVTATRFHHRRTVSRDLTMHSIPVPPVLVGMATSSARY